MNTNYHRPANLEEVLRILSAEEGGVLILAGGTDLVPRVFAALPVETSILDIGGIAALGTVEETAGCIRIGSLVSHSRIARSPLLRDRCPVLSEGARSVGSPQIRTAGTLGGNIANASPAGDLIPPLYVLDAQVALASSRGGREVPLRGFFRGPGLTVRREDELILGVRFKPPARDSIGFFRKMGQRNAQAITQASLAVQTRIVDGRFEEIRIALGAVASTVLRAGKTETLLTGGKAGDESLWRKAAESVLNEITPIDDVRGSAWFRETIVRHLFLEAYHDIRLLRQ